MNNFSISLSSNDSEYYTILESLDLYDYTKLTVNFENISEKHLPLYLKIDWGDGEIEFYDNDVFANQTVFKKSEIINTVRTHEYYPSDTSLYKQLTAQFYISYSNGENTWIIQPINIRNYDFFESVEDLDVVGVEIQPNIQNKKTLYLKTKKDSYIINLKE